METVMEWLGFIGGWVLFAGPIYQATLELQEQDIEVDQIRAAGKNIEAPKEVSAWWWLFPPAKYVLERHRSRALRRAFFDALLSEDAEALMAFFNKATGWLMVAVGALCIAVNETYGLVEYSHWAGWTFWALAVAMAALSILNAVVRHNRTKIILAQKD